MEAFGVVAALAAAAALSPPPALRVCLEPHLESPCQSGPIVVEADVTAYGVSGPATLRWLVDGQARQVVEIAVADSVPSRNLLVFTPRASRHTLSLEVVVGPLRNRAALDLEPSFCPFDLGVETVVVEPGRNLVVSVTNHGPGPSGSWSLRLVVDGRRAYASPMDSLGCGEHYELVVPWSDEAGGGGAQTGGLRHGAPWTGVGPRGQGGRTVFVLLDVSAGDLDASNDVCEIIAPR